MDVLQLFFRKLAGLDVYYVDGKPVSGDLVTNFITGILRIDTSNVTYSTLSTIFWSFVVFGLIICFISTITAIIKSHYSYDEKSAKGPMPIVYTAGKAVLNMVAVPIIIVLGLYLSEAILQALDSITTTDSSSIVSMYGSDVVGKYLRSTETSKGGLSVDEDGNVITGTGQTYTYYDIFGFTGRIAYGIDTLAETIADATDMAKIGARTEPFSGSIFKVAAYNANRVRTGQYNLSTPFTGTKDCFSGMKLFNNAEDDTELALMIDTAFANFLHLNKEYVLDYVSSDYGASAVADLLHPEQYLTMFTTIHVSAFSKFNVGLVWYYYNLWQFNFIVGFAAGIVCVAIFFNIILGLMTRLFMCIILFLIAPPLAGLAPLDGGKAFKSWREGFLKQVLMAYGAIVGMNLVLMILPYINKIDFFNIPIADYVAQTLFIIVGLISVKAAISLTSGLIGSEDASKTGENISGDVMKVSGKALGMTVGAAKVGGKALLNLTPGGIALKQGAKAFANSNAGRTAGNILKQTGALVTGGLGGLRREQERQRAQEDLNQVSKDEFLDSLQGRGTLTADQVRDEALAAGMSRTDADAIARAAGGRSLADARAIRSVKNRLAVVDSGYRALRRRGRAAERALTRQAGESAEAFERRQRQAYNRAINQERDRAQGTINANNRVDAYRRAHPGVLRSMGQTFMAAGGEMLGNFGVYGKNIKGFDDFLDQSGIKPPKRDYARETADNTAAMLAAQQATNSSLGTLNSSVNTGFANTHDDLGTVNGKIDLANASLDEISETTGRSAAANERTAMKVEALDKRAEKVLQGQRDAHRQRAHIEDKVNVIVNKVTKKKPKKP